MIVKESFNGYSSLKYYEKENWFNQKSTIEVHDFIWFFVRLSQFLRKVKKNQKMTIRRHKLHRICYQNSFIMIKISNKPSVLNHVYRCKKQNKNTYTSLLNQYIFWFAWSLKG